MLVSAHNPTTTARLDWRYHLLLPLLMFASAILIIESFNLDLALGQYLFALEGGIDSWPLRNAWITEHFIHVGGRNLVILLGLVILGLLLASQKKVRLRRYRRGLIFLFLSVLSAVLLVRLGKEFIHLDCPWHLSIFGGKAQYFSLFSGQTDPQSPGQCFPAGHSSGGYAWVALYFFCLVYRPKLRWYGLGFGLLLGMIFGISQQLRGAHFISHDIWSLTISWCSALSWYYLLFCRPAREATALPDTELAPS